MALKQRLKDLPDSSGVYIMKDKKGTVLYVGKAASLRKRVSSYFQSARYLSPRSESLILNVEDIEYILSPSEAQALLLEANLIKRFKPKYNVAFRDDKSFPLIKITKEDFPAILICRPKRKVNARYFGPYTNVKLLRSALKTIGKVFPFRTCLRLPKRACLNYHLELCPGPCIGKITKRDYRKTIESICLILEGRQEELIKELLGRMRQEAERENFEEAARIRDQISALSSIYTSTGRYGGIGQMEELKSFLQLPILPRRIEAFDISNIFGRQAVGSMVSFYDGKPDKNNYRRFRIKTVGKIDDYGMLAEVISRRYRRVKEEKLPYPDLILIDGGRGHVSIAKEELERIGLNLPIAAIAKKEEHIYLSGRKFPLVLPAASGALRLLQRVRNEAHRFALKYHHILRRKKTFEEKR